MDILVKWKNPNIEYDGTHIYRSETPLYEVSSIGEPIATVGTGIEEYLDVGLVRGQTYYYRFATFRGTDVVMSDMLTVKALRYTGPGSQELIAGDEEIGYYGEVPYYELFSAGEFLSAIPAINGVKGYDLSVWYKFAYRGKTLYIPDRPLRYNTTYLSLYNAGLVFGVDGPGTDAMTSPVNQLTIIERGEDKFIVKIPDSGGGIYHTEPGTQPSIWNDLITRMVFQVGQFQRGANLIDSTSFLRWSLTNNNSSSEILCQETNGINSIRRGIRPLNADYQLNPDAFRSYAVGSTTYYPLYLPVLELVD